MASGPVPTDKEVSTFAPLASVLSLLAVVEETDDCGGFVEETDACGGFVFLSTKNLITEKLTAGGAISSGKSGTILGTVKSGKELEGAVKEVGKVMGRQTLYWGGGGVGEGELLESKGSRLMTDNASS